MKKKRFTPTTVSRSRVEVGPPAWSVYKKTQKKGRSHKSTNHAATLWISDPQEFLTPQTSPDQTSPVPEVYGQKSQPLTISPVPLRASEVPEPEDESLGRRKMVYPNRTASVSGRGRCQNHIRLVVKEESVQ